MALDTYSGLKTSVARFLNRGDLSGDIPDWVTLAEAQMRAALVRYVDEKKKIPRRLISRSDATIALGTEYIAVPTDFVGPINFILKTDPLHVVKFANQDTLIEKRRLRTTAGRPDYYTVVGGELRFDCIADVAYPAEMTYIGNFVALSDANPTNWILALYPNAYLYGALLQSAPFMKADARLAVWTSLFASATSDICGADPVPTSRVTLATELAHMGRRPFYQNRNC